jgi:hypothetical protein
VPIDPNPPSFVTSYLVSADGAVVAVQLSIPGRILSSNQSVYLPAPSIDEVDEVAVRNLWSTNRIVKEPSNARTQFRYLQELVHINEEFMERYDGQPHLDATTLRSAFMLFQVVANLANNTWYVIDPDTRRVIDYAKATLMLGHRREKACSWLGREACGGLDRLITSVDRMNSVRFTRMYDELIPDGTKLTLDTCAGGLPQDLRKFLRFLHEANESDGTQSISETRVANDIAACETRLALCTPQAPEQAIIQLDATIAFLEPYRALARQRLVEMERARSDLAAGRPAVCPP